MAHENSHAVPRLPDCEARIARDTYLSGLTRFPSALLKPGHDLLARIETSNWLLEWSLPYWLGQAFGLPCEATRALTAGNVFGLAYVRLQDDMVDAEPTGAAQRAGPLLAAAIYHLWLDTYRALFDASSPFWRSFDAHLVEWVRGTLYDHGATPAGAQPDVNEAHALELAARGAPLKVGVTGACVLAGRDGDIPAAEAAIDSLLGAAVLLDHVQDWQDDLAEGRYNAFVAYAALRQKETGNVMGLEQAVLTELFLRDTAEPYFVLIHRLIDRSRKAVRPLCCDELVRYLDYFDERAAGYRRRLAEHAARTLRAGVDRFFGGVGEPEAAMEPSPSTGG